MPDPKFPDCAQPTWPCFLRDLATGTLCLAHPDTRFSSGCDDCPTHRINDHADDERHAAQGK